jgi:hypothetical protein
MQGYAVCANRDALDGYVIKHKTVQVSSRFQHTAASCPSGTVAYGSGADVHLPGRNEGDANGQVGLQLIRTSGPLDISRGAGRANNTFSGTWELTSWAICAKPAFGVHAEGTVVQGAFGTHACKTLGDQVTGPGGGGGLTDGGPVWLQVIYPYANLRRVDVQLTGTPIGGMVASAVCASD